jgi:uncharacterized UPF0160 family protein
VIYKVKQKLKEEYAGLPGKELSNLKKSGVEVCLPCWMLKSILSTI